jgi:hypothetical protein
MFRQQSSELSLIYELFITPSNEPQGTGYIDDNYIEEKKAMLGWLRQPEDTSPAAIKSFFSATPDFRLYIRRLASAHTCQPAIDALDRLTASPQDEEKEEMPSASLAPKLIMNSRKYIITNFIFSKMDEHRKSIYGDIRQTTYGILDFSGCDLKDVNHFAWILNAASQNPTIHTWKFIDCRFSFDFGLIRHQYRPLALIALINAANNNPHLRALYYSDISKQYLDEKKHIEAMEDKYAAELPTINNTHIKMISIANVNNFGANHFISKTNGKVIINHFPNIRHQNGNELNKLPTHMSVLCLKNMELDWHDQYHAKNRYRYKEEQVKLKNYFLQCPSLKAISIGLTYSAPALSTHIFPVVPTMIARAAEESQIELITITVKGSIVDINDTNLRVVTEKLNAEYKERYTTKATLALDQIRHSSFNPIFEILNIVNEYYFKPPIKIVYDIEDSMLNTYLTVAADEKTYTFKKQLPTSSISLSAKLKSICFDPAIITTEYFLDEIHQMVIKIHQTPGLQTSTSGVLKELNQALINALTIGKTIDRTLLETVKEAFSHAKTLFTMFKKSYNFFNSHPDSRVISLFNSLATSVIKRLENTTTLQLR